MWIVIGNLFELAYTKQDLEFKKGRIVYFDKIITKTINKPLYKSIEKEVQIKLDNYPEYFRLTDNFKCDTLLNNLKLGDTITIYYRKKFLVPLGFGKQTDIYQLEYKNQVLFDIIQRKNNSKSLILVGIIATIIFGGFYIYPKYKFAKSGFKSK